MRPSLLATVGLDRSIAALDNLSVKLTVSLGAAKSLAALPQRDRRTLFARVEAFAADPFGAHPAARPLRGHEDRIRIRHGEWRAICRIDRATETVLLERVAHRREAYR
jgi:mRNA-degrading endonuclease RelE of RelBE toxin-antitoxin system